ncbi:MAG: SpoIIE family protein phosphatase [Acidobacteria bacterium]|nr:SpoIIE family protein phosphatase [Acidobacteriota bacterium]
MEVEKLPQLILLEPDGSRRALLLNCRTVSIGRHASNDLALRDNRISRQHAVIRQQNGCYVVEDCGSRHGTLVNGEPVREARRLENNDRIEFGASDSYAVVFVTEEASRRRLLDTVDTDTRPAPRSRELEKLRVLLGVGHSLYAGLEADEVLARVLDACLEVSGAERGFLALRSDAGELAFRLGRHRSGRGLGLEEFKVNQTVVERAMASGQDVVLRAARATAGGESRTVLCLPVRPLLSAGPVQDTPVGSARHALGFFYLESERAARRFSGSDRQILRLLAGEAASVVANARLLEATRAHESLENELAMARGIQKALLPASPQEHGFFQMAGAHIPSYAVGGDYYDLIELRGRGFAAVIADVSGKGISAALRVSTLQGVLAAGLHWGQPLASAVGYLNRYIWEHTSSNEFATLFCGVLSLDGRFDYANAGHVPALWVTADGIRTLTAGGLPLGMFTEDSCATNAIRLSAGDLLVFYTDGLIEAFNAEGESYGMTRLQKVLAEGRALSAEELVSAVLADLRAFAHDVSLQDDVSLMVVRYHGDVLEHIA